MKRALLFDCDGVLADTERDGHLVAFNRMWREQGVNWQWTLAQYAEKLKIGGGKERLASLARDEDFRAATRCRHPRTNGSRLWPSGTGARARFSRSSSHPGAIPGRPGVKRLAQEALSRRLDARGVLDFGARIGAGGSGVRRRGRRSAVSSPECSPAISSRQRNRRRTSTTSRPRSSGSIPADCVVVEDSRNGLLAATAAGMPCIITVNDLTKARGFRRSGNRAFEPR